MSTAQETLRRAAQHIDDRAASRDMPNGERSMGRAVAAFNALNGLALTETQGWQFMVCLKMARATAGKFNADDYEDMAAYAALAGECEATIALHEEEAKARTVLTAFSEFKIKPGTLS